MGFFPTPGAGGGFPGFPGGPGGPGVPGGPGGPGGPGFPGGTPGQFPGCTGRRSSADGSSTAIRAANVVYHICH